MSKFTHGQPSNDFPFGKYEEFIKKEFQDYNQSCAACAKWGWGEAQNEIQILRKQLMQADKIAKLSAAYAQLNEEYDVLSKARDQLQGVIDCGSAQQDILERENKALRVDRDQLLNLIERAAPLLMDVPAKDKYGPNAPELNVEASFVVATEMYEALAKGED